MNDQLSNRQQIEILTGFFLHMKKIHGWDKLEYADTVQELLDSDRPLKLPDFLRAFKAHIVDLEGYVAKLESQKNNNGIEKLENEEAPDMNASWLAGVSFDRNSVRPDTMQKFLIAKLGGEYGHVDEEDVEDLSSQCDVGRGTLLNIIESAAEKQFLKSTTIRKICIHYKVTPQEINQFVEKNYKNDNVERDNNKSGLYTQKDLENLDIDVEGFADILKQIRQQKNWPQQRLADCFNFNVNIVVGHENGDVEEVYLPLLKAVVNGFGLQPTDVENYCQTKEMPPRLKVAIKAIPS